MKTTAAHRRLRPLALLLAGLSLLVLGVSSCGDSDDRPPVATIAGKPISASEFDDWLAQDERRFRTDQRLAREIEGMVVEPPPFTRCIARVEARMTNADRYEGRINPRNECETTWNVFKDRTMQKLIALRWFEQVAAESDVQVTDAEAKEAIEQQLAADRENGGAEFNGRDYDELVKDGISASYLNDLGRSLALQQKLIGLQASAPPAISEQEIRQAYERNRKAYTDQRLTFARARAQIEAGLRQQAASSAGTRFLEETQRRLKAVTRCRAGYVVGLCANAPSGPEKLESVAENDKRLNPNGDGALPANVRAKDRKQVTSLATAFYRAFGAEDVAALCKLPSKTARVLTASGDETCEERFTKLYAEAKEGKQAGLARAARATVQSVRLANDWAVVTMEFGDELTGPIDFVRQDGEWKVATYADPMQITGLPGQTPPAQDENGRVVQNEMSPEAQAAVQEALAQARRAQAQQQQQGQGVAP